MLDKFLQLICLNNFSDYFYENLEKYLEENINRVFIGKFYYSNKYYEDFEELENYDNDTGQYKLKNVKFYEIYHKAHLIAYYSSTEGYILTDYGFNWIKRKFISYLKTID